MITVKCDKCGKIIEDGTYREIQTNVRHHIPDSNGFYTVTAEFRPTMTHQLCARCSGEFDAYFDKCVADFLDIF